MQDFFRTFLCSNFGKNNICFFLLMIFRSFEENNFSIENFIYSRGWWILHFWKHGGLDIRFGKAAMFLVFLILRFLSKNKIFSGHDFSITQNALLNKIECLGPLKPTLRFLWWDKSVSFAISIAGTETMKPSVISLRFFSGVLLS